MQVMYWAEAILITKYISNLGSRKAFVIVMNKMLSRRLTCMYMFCTKLRSWDFSFRKTWLSCLIPVSWSQATQNTKSICLWRIPPSPLTHKHLSSLLSDHKQGLLRPWNNSGCWHNEYKQLQIPNWSSKCWFCTIFAWQKT